MYWFNFRHHFGGTSMKSALFFRTREGIEKLCREKGIPLDIIQESMTDEEAFEKSDMTSTVYDYMDLKA